jgi:putative ABC transport system ATP-binding protein
MTNNSTFCGEANEEISAIEIADLSRALVFLARQLDRPCEESHASRLLAEVIRANPGAGQDYWWRWLLSAGRSLGLSMQVADIPAADLPVLLRSGAIAVAERRVVEIQKLNLPKRSLQRLCVVEHGGDCDNKSFGAPEPNTLRVILVIPGSHGVSEHKPLVMLWKLISPDQSDLLALVVISGAAGLLMLSVPVAAQQLVRNVTFATLYQPIVVLSLLLLGLLGFVAALQALQVYVAEIIQRRLFLRVASQVSHRLVRADVAVWTHHSVSDLVNRFLEVAVVQKVAASLLVDGIAIVLTTVIGMGVMAFYHPFLLGYDALLVLVLTAILFGFGPSGVRTAVEESRAKYDVLSWLEDLARCPSVFRIGGVEPFAIQRTEVLCDTYLRRRGTHFAILIRQIILILMLQAIATTTLLGLGGFLVLNEQLTLGQLVAAELIVTMIIASFAKLGKHLEGWYDLLASINKLSHLFDLPPESNDGLVGISFQGPVELVFAESDSSTLSPGEHPESRSVRAGESAALLDWNRSLTAEIAQLLQGQRHSSALHLMIDRIRIDDIRPDILRQHVSVVASLEFLPASVAENIHLSRSNIFESDVYGVCESTGLNVELANSGLNLTTSLLPNGWPLHGRQQVLLALARVLAGKPRLLYLDHILDTFNETEFQELWQQLSRIQSHTTIVMATGRADLAKYVGSVIPEPRNLDRCSQPQH